MTEAVVDQRNTVSTTGFANPLNLPANAEAASDVLVYGDDTLLVNGVDYTLDGVGDLGDLDAIAGVDVTIEQDVIDADLYATFTVVHAPPLVQDSDLSGGGTLGRLYEVGLDAITRRLQSVVQNSVDRSLRLSVDTIDTITSLPAPEDRRALVWALDQDTGDYSIVNSYSDPDTEPVTTAEEAAAAAEAQAVIATAQAVIATAQAQAAADSAADAVAAAATAGDLTALLNFLWPVGAKLEHFGSTAPANFLACDGSAVSRATYSALFAVIGTTYGAGNGTTTFNLPTWNDGRFTRATGGNAAAQGTLQAQLIGTHGHTLTIDSGGTHTHAVNRNKRYGANDNSSGNANPGLDVGDQNNGAYSFDTASGGTHTHTGSVADHTATENRPANSAVLVCIKY